MWTLYSQFVVQHFIFLFLSTFHRPERKQARRHQILSTCVCLCTPPLPSSPQTDEERQQALQAFTAQAFLTSPSLNAASGSGASAPAFPSPSSSSEPKPKPKRGSRKNLKEKYRLKYLRLRKAARAMVFVSKWCIYLFCGFHSKRHNLIQSDRRNTQQQSGCELTRTETNNLTIEKKINI